MLKGEHRSKCKGERRSPLLASQQHVNSTQAYMKAVARCIGQNIDYDYDHDNDSEGRTGQIVIVVVVVIAVDTHDLYL